MAINIKRYTVEDFEAFLKLPENADKLFEFIAGEIAEVPIDLYSSGKLLANAMTMFVKVQKLGHVSFKESYFTPYNERYLPKIAFMPKQKIERIKQVIRVRYNLIPPDLVVEFDAPTNNHRQMRVKIANYLSVGTRVWYICPDSQEVEVYVPNQPMKILGIKDSLDGGEVLEGFSLPIAEIFPEEE